jgi:signal transduction histidine kinase
MYLPFSRLDCWKHMTMVYAQLAEPLASEVTMALIDLAALARKASWVPSRQLEGVANDLLTRLLSLCKAERGAVLLREEHGMLEQSGPASAAAAHTHVFRTLALQSLLEEEVHALLSALPATDAPARSPDVTCWMVYRLTVGEGMAGDAQRPLEVLPDVSFVPAEQARHALLVMGWTNEPGQERACASLITRCSALLPLIADAAGVVIAMLLLKERLREIESTSAQEALERMELLKAELLGTVSHELRSPLASIKGYAGTLLRHERGLAREERHQFLLAITEASDRLEVIIERLLEVSQLETGQITLQRSPVDMVHLAGEAIAAMEERLTAARPGRFVFHLLPEHAEGTPVLTAPLILADPRRLREVLDNLLENATKYSPEGGVIDVTLRPVDQSYAQAQGEDVARGREERGQGTASAPRKMLEVCVSDEGQGIPVEHLDRIFERFHRVDTRLTRETSGLGLGLTICKRIVELHGGVVWAENRTPGRGSAFHVRLPIDEGELLY